VQLSGHNLLLITETAAILPYALMLVQLISTAADGISLVLHSV